MTENRPPQTVDQVVAEIRREIARPLPEARDAGSSVEIARDLQRKFRNEPVGGRLSFLKRLVYWWVASAFDRQGKVVEALISEVESLHLHRAALERRLALLEANGGASAERELAGR